MSRNITGTTVVTVFLHVIGWCCFLIYPFIIGVTLREEIFFRVLLHTSLLAGFFYLNIYFLIPRYLGKDRTTQYVAYVLLAILLIVLANVAFGSYFSQSAARAAENFPSKRYMSPYYDIRRFARPLISSLFVFAVSTSYKMLSDWYRKERQKREVENENLVSELSFLRSQVSPHFLFNTLNNIYSLSLSDSQRASASIMKLSQLLRYMLYESDGRQVLLEKELDYLENYIDLQKMRLRSDVQVEFKVTGNPADFRIEPMLLIPFVENAFKHGVNYSGKSDIAVALDVNNGFLQMRVENYLHRKSGDKDPASGIGLVNVRRRLNLLYPARHVLNVQELEEKFIVELKLSLNK